MRRLALLGLLLFPLAGCQQQPAPPAPAVAPPPPPAPHVEAPPPPVSAAWSFAMTTSTCEAHATHRGLSLTLHVSGNSIALTLAGDTLRRLHLRTGTRTQLRFAGSAGSWSVPARFGSDRSFSTAIPLDQTGANHVLVLLSGGNLRTSAVQNRIPALHIPDSDVSGREWFDCVRQKLPS
jgi:hypothetical protein